MIGILEESAALTAARSSQSAIKVPGWSEARVHSQWAPDEAISPCWPCGLTVNFDWSPVGSGEVDPPPTEMLTLFRIE